MRRRIGEKVKAWFRSERFYHTGLGWWFMTREGAEFGPFVSEKDAESELCLCIRSVNLSRNSLVNPSGEIHKI